LDTAQYSANENELDKTKSSLHTASEERKVDVVKAFFVQAGRKYQRQKHALHDT